MIEAAAAAAFSDDLPSLSATASAAWAASHEIPTLGFVCTASCTDKFFPLLSECEVPAALHPADGARGQEGTMQVGMCKWTATTVLILSRLTHSDGQSSRCCESICISSCCSKASVKHPGDFSLQVATDEPVMADVGIALSELDITSLRMCEAPPTVHHAMSGEPYCHVGHSLTYIASAGNAY